jgi:peptidoglycan hydrolase CwlO-like protein
MKHRNAYVGVLIALCAAFLAFRLPVWALTSADIQAQQSDLQRQLKDIQAQISSYERQLTTIKSQKNTLANKIAQLEAERAKLTLQIEESKVQLQDTETRLAQTQSGIDDHEKRLTALKAEMDAILRQLYKQDRRSLIQILLSGKGLSDFFAEVNGELQLNDSLAAVVGQYHVETDSLRDQQRHLADQKDHQQNLFAILQIQDQDLDDSLGRQDELLKATKGKEANYQSALTDTKKQAAEIRNRIYKLIEVGKQVTFGEAVAVAQWASSQTGVRPAFLLAVLTQESNLGANVGTCNRAGDPPSKSWKAIMKPDRDQQPFIAITRKLGKPTDTTPVSCPMRDKDGNRIGWGGAMGPAQFIPSTWVGYESRIAAVTGKTADPWDMRDAFLAAALLLKANGAGTRSGEWAAAMRYFSGSTDTTYRFYGDNVVATAARYQNDIDDLNRK